MSHPCLPSTRPSWGAGRRPARHVKRALTRVRTLSEQTESALVSRTAPPADIATVAQLTQPCPARTRLPGSELTTSGHPSPSQVSS